MFRLLVIIAIATRMGGGERFRLPKIIKPTRYYLTMDPNFSAATHTFSGSVVIQFQAVSSTTTITLHSKDLKIATSAINLVSAAGTPVRVSRTSSNTDLETFTIHLRQPLATSEQYNLTISRFNGVLGTSDGFFFDRVPTTEGESLMAGTHFQSKGARKAFPCFDEPSFKATFVVSIIRLPKFFSLANQELDYTEKLRDGRFKDVYKETPQMSTYLVAFSVLNFKSTAALERHRVYATPDVINHVSVPLQLSVAMLKSLEQYTGIGYQLPKLDHLVVPNPFIIDNAMENWGLILYRERNFKYTPTAVKDIKRVVTFMAHEFSHQWFGNLVTPEFWDYIWMSESFATYFQYYTASQIQPTWRLMDQFNIDILHQGFLDEEQKGAHPLTYEVQNDQRFPPFHVMYEKGASIVRMMVHFLSHSVFQSAVRRFLSKWQFQNVIPSDLYETFQEEINSSVQKEFLGDLNFGDIMSGWEKNRGYPIVTVTRNYVTGFVTLKQHSPFENGTLWSIPINYAYSFQPNYESTTANFWLSKEHDIIYENVTAEGWLLINKQQTGRFRVNYDMENWKRIMAVLQSDDYERVHVLNRAQLINDAFYLASKKIIPVSLPLTMGEYLVRERDYIPFAAFCNSLANYVYTYNGNSDPDETKFFLNHRFKDQVTPPKPNDYTQEYKIFREYIRYITANIRAILGSQEKPTDSFVDKLLRIDIDRFFPFFFLD
ncbi:hypothetical protein PPYR_13410 [Photinus pyralis]|uniref:Aminopeptidase n=1 Tax=Photinus pyralis TaxID=7054 RepID=A0A5N4A8Z2_PHOPY|nr:aminopeptidase N-like [Photinus pyralis]KAB0793790.1 hypothetical protein PPYR_13410 [Photinus pyralis]